jgi:hypothetical protein
LYTLSLWVLAKALAPKPATIAKVETYMIKCSVVEARRSDD